MVNRLPRGLRHHVGLLRRGFDGQLQRLLVQLAAGRNVVFDAVDFAHAAIHQHANHAVEHIHIPARDTQRVIRLIAVHNRGFAAVIIRRVICVARRHDVIVRYAQFEQLSGDCIDDLVHARLRLGDGFARNARVRRHFHHVRRGRHFRRALHDDLHVVSVGKGQRRDGQHQRQRNRKNLFHVRFPPVRFFTQLSVDSFCPHAPDDSLPEFIFIEALFFLVFREGDETAVVIEQHILISRQICVGLFLGNFLAVVQFMAFRHAEIDTPF